MIEKSYREVQLKTDFVFQYRKARKGDIWQAEQWMQFLQECIA
jgi:hypothetical protein